jgi:hypothetical protein
MAILEITDLNKKRKAWATWAITEWIQFKSCSKKLREPTFRRRKKKDWNS